MGMELGQQKKRSESVWGGADRVSILSPSAAAPVIPAANYNADNAIPSHTTARHRCAVLAKPDHPGPAVEGTDWGAV